jgi:hypothetical protein
MSTVAPFDYSYNYNFIPYYSLFQAPLFLAGIEKYVSTRYHSGHQFYLTLTSQLCKQFVT